MGEKTEIAWCDSTFNGWLGCQKVSAGCDHCYAEAMMDHRYGKVKWGPHGERKRTSYSNWQLPKRWARKANGVRRRVFCSSLSDVFDNQAPVGARADLFNLIKETPELDWLLLTKRPENIKKMLPDDWGDGWSHVWLGTTCENQEWFDRRWPILAAVPARIRFVSYEPAIGPLDISSMVKDNPVYEKQAERGVCLSGGSERRLGNYARRDGLASQKTWMGHPSPESDRSSLPAGPSGAPRREEWGIPSSGADGGRSKGFCAGSSSGLSSLQGVDPTRPNGEPQAWEKERERSGGFGAGDLFGTTNSCGPRLESRTRLQSGRPEEQHGEADGRTGQSNQGPQVERGAPSLNSGRLRDKFSGGIEDSQRRPLGKISWLICGGESGPGHRPMDPQWAISLRDQCAHYGIAFFFKQMAGKKPIPENLLVRQFPLAADAPQLAAQA